MKKHRVRNGNWKVRASIIQKKCSNELLHVGPRNGAPLSLGLAIDVGTTSIVVYLVDMQDGSIIAAAADHNRQAACGDDVINRIVCAEKDGVKKLSRMALVTINSLIAEALNSAGVDSISGRTADALYRRRDQRRNRFGKQRMAHDRLLLGRTGL